MTMIDDELISDLLPSPVRLSRTVRPSVRTAVFVVSDSYAGEVSDPVSLNKYIYGNDDPVQNYDPSGQSSSLAAAALGRAVHKKLGQIFKDQLGDYGVSGPSIVSILQKDFGPLTSFVGPITSRFPDLVDIDPKNKEVFEIKPANLKAYAAGLAQLIGYIYLLNKLDPKGGWHEGDAATFSPPPILTIVDPQDDPEDPVEEVACFPPIAGVITYSSVSDVIDQVKQRVRNASEAEDDELENDIGVDTTLETLET
jgi:hypothetical protein